MNRFAVGANARDHDLRIKARLILELHQPDDDAVDQLTARNWRTKDQYVERIAVVRDRLRDDAVVHRIAADRLRDHAVDRAAVGAHVEFPLASIAACNLDVGVHGSVAVDRRCVTPLVILVTASGIQAGGERLDRGRRQRGRPHVVLRANHERNEHHHDEQEPGHAVALTILHVSSMA